MLIESTGQSGDNKWYSLIPDVVQHVLFLKFCHFSKDVEDIAMLWFSFSLVNNSPKPFSVFSWVNEY